MTDWRNEDAALHNKPSGQFATLIDLLDSWGIDLRPGSAIPARIARHAGDGGAAQSFYELGAEEFEWYQSAQKTKIFGDAKILVSFIKTYGYEASFVGAYQINGCEEGHSKPPFAHNIPQILLDKCNVRWHYRLTRLTEFDCFKGRIRIDWDSPESRWVRQNVDANRRIVGLKMSSGEWVTPRDKDSLLKVGLIPPQLDLETETIDYSEGSRSLKIHVQIERNHKLVRESKDRFKKRHGRLFCEACRFDFFVVYGEEYIECHHTIPVHQLSSDGSTSIDDVVLLCANCHRVVHRRKEWLGMDHLRLLLSKRNL